MKLKIFLCKKSVIVTLATAAYRAQINHVNMSKQVQQFFAV
jgi:hypothetical protein